MVSGKPGNYLTTGKLHYVEIKRASVLPAMSEQETCYFVVPYHSHPGLHPYVVVFGIDYRPFTMPGATKRS